MIYSFSGIFYINAYLQIRGSKFFGFGEITYLKTLKSMVLSQIKLFKQAGMKSSSQNKTTHKTKHERTLPIFRF
jgi:hypothetical protein